MAEIPDWIDEKLEVKPRADIQDEAIVEYFLESEAPYHSRKQIQNEFGWSKQNANNRLQDLVELRVLEDDSIADGTIYWINRDDSDWPIPPDADIEPSTDNSLIETLSRDMRFFAAVGVLGIVVGGLLVVIAPFLTALGFYSALGASNGAGTSIVVGWFALLMGFVFVSVPTLTVFKEYRARQ